jgi:hypothetical protein
MIALETQEAGTGKWFPVTIYSHGNKSQSEDAENRANALRAIGLYARVTWTETAA